MKSKGFTVLEFLIAIGIIAILISLVLVGLNRVRSNSRDQELVSKLQTVTLGLQQFYDICSLYPATLDGSETCPSLDSQNKTIKDLLPELTILKFNQSDSRYFYTGIETGNSNRCTGFHIGVQMDKYSETIGLAEANINSQGQECTGGRGFDGRVVTMFDIKK